MIIESDRAETPAARPQAVGEGEAPAADFITSLSAGASPPNVATDSDPVAAPPSSGAAPADDPDWHTKDAAGNYGTAYAAIRAAHVAAGKARLHPDDAGPMPAFLRRVTA